MKFEFSQQTFQKKKSWKDVNWELSNFKQTDMMEIIVPFHNFMYAPNYWIFPHPSRPALEPNHPPIQMVPDPSQR